MILFSVNNLSGAGILLESAEAVASFVIPARHCASINSIKPVLQAINRHSGSGLISEWKGGVFIKRIDYLVESTVSVIQFSENSLILLAC